MIKSLVAIYHSRVDYPGYVPPNSGQFKFVPDEDDGEEGGMKYADPADIPVSKAARSKTRRSTGPRAEKIQAKGAE